MQSLPDNEAPTSSGKRRGLAGKPGKRRLVDDDTTTAAATVTQSWEVYFELGAGQEVEAVAGSLLTACQLSSPDCLLSGVTAAGQRRARRGLQGGEGGGGSGGSATLTRPLTSGLLNAPIPNLAGSGVAVSRAARPSRLETASLPPTPPHDSTPRPSSTSLPCFTGRACSCS